ncbi:MAG: flagellar basal body P-ring protein FlgI [Candidatus Nucleicultricaceae bacterium]
MSYSERPYSLTIFRIKPWLQLVFNILVVSCLSSTGFSSHRVKDIVSFESVRDNQLVGYGIVVGLNGTGDDMKGSPNTQETLLSMLERLGVNVRDRQTDLKSKNAAAVMVTANLPAFSRHGGRIDVTVSAMGTAKSLAGGTLLVTPLMGADGNVYAVAQGSVAIGGYSAQSNAAGDAGSSVTKGVPTSGRIANGAIVERELGFQLASLDNMNLALKNPDFTTAKRIAQAINTYTNASTAKALDPSTVKLTIPGKYKGDIHSFISDVEQLKVQSDQPARVVLDEQNGVIVIGENVRISTVAISHGNLTIRITETPQVSQPNPFSNVGNTEVVNRTKIEIEEEKNKKLMVMKEGVNLQQLVNGLNALGVSPRDMITILRAIKAAGALQAEIEGM